MDVLRDRDRDAFALNCADVGLSIGRGSASIGVDRKNISAAFADGGAAAGGVTKPTPPLASLPVPSDDLNAETDDGWAASVVSIGRTVCNGCQP